MKKWISILSLFSILLSTGCATSKPGHSVLKKPKVVSKSNKTSKNIDNFKIGKPFVQIGHSGYVISIAISLDGKYALSGSKDKTLRYWDLQTGKTIKVLKGHKSSVKSVAISPDGKYALSGSWDTLRYWDLQTGKTINILKGHTSGVNSVAISPDGKYALSGSWDKTLRYWDLESGETIKVLKGHTDSVESVAISPDGRYALSGSKDNTLRYWNLESGETIKVLKGHTDSVESVAISPDGRYALSGSKDKTLRYWDLESGKTIKVFKGHKADVFSVAISPDGKNALSGSIDQIIRYWDLKTGKTIKKIQGCTSVAMSHNSQYALLGGYRVLQYWNLHTTKKIRTLEGNLENISLITVNQNGDYIGINNNRSKLEYFSLKEGKPVHPRNILGWNNSFNITHDGKYAISQNNKGKVKTIRYWDLTTGKTIHILKGHKKYITSVAISPDGKYALSGSFDKTIRYWDLKTGQTIKVFKDYEHSIYSVVISPDGRYAIWGGLDILQYLDLKTGETINFFKGDGIGAKSLVISSDSRHALSGGLDGTLRYWDLQSAQSIKVLEGHTEFVTSVAISPDGKYAISGSDDNTLRYWDLQSGKILKVIQNDNIIKFIRLSSNNLYAIAVTNSNEIKYWDLQTGEEILKFISFKDGEWIAITPDGYFNASKNGAKHLNILTGPMEVSGIDQFYDKFYRPDIIKLAFQGKKVDTGLKLADVKPAPKVQIVNTVEKTDKKTAQVTLKIEEQRGGGIGDIKLFINGVSVKTDQITRALELKKGNTIYKTYTIKLIKGKNIIKAIVYNEANSMNSREVFHTIEANFKTIYKPSIYAIIIGIDKFKNPKLTLNYASSDAKLFANTLRQSAKGLFENINITLLTTKQDTTKQKIIGTIKAHQDINPNDLFVFYVASHGTIDDGEYFLITSNVGATSTRKLKKDAIPQTQLKNLLSNIPTTKKMIVLDTCNAGQMGDALQIAMLTRGMSEDTAMKLLSRAVGSTIFSAATSTQEALEGYKNHGLFTYVLSEGLKGKADSNNDGFIKTRELADYVEDEVPQLAEKIYNRAQYPVISPSGSAFPVGKVK
jgi:WD40 repeat protein